MIPNDTDLEMAELAEQADANQAARKGARPFDPVKDGPHLRAYVEGAVYNMTSVYASVTVCGEDYGFAPDDQAQDFSFTVARAYQAKLEAEEREAMGR